MGSVIGTIRDQARADDEKQLQRIKENLAKLEEIGRMSLDAMKTTLISNQSQRGQIAHEIPTRSVIRWDEGMRCGVSEASIEHIGKMIDEFFRGNLLEGFKQVVKGAVSGLLGSASAGAQRSSHYYVIIINDAIVRVDASFYLYQASYKGIYETAENLVTWVYSISSVDMKAIKEDPSVLIYLLTEQTKTACLEFIEGSVEDRKLKREDLIKEKTAILDMLKSLYGISIGDQSTADTELQKIAEKIDDYHPEEVADWAGKSAKLTAESLWGYYAPGTTLSWYLEKKAADMFGDGVLERDLKIAFDDWDMSSDAFKNYLGNDLDGKPWDMSKAPKFKQVLSQEQADFCVCKANSKQEDEGPNVLAEGFYPQLLYDNRNKKNPTMTKLYIYKLLASEYPKSLLTTLRHEVGHILGFRHEHIWDKDYCASRPRLNEDKKTAILLGQEFDPFSIMNYKYTNMCRQTEKAARNAIMCGKKDIPKIDVGVLSKSDKIQSAWYYHEKILEAQQNDDDDDEGFEEFDMKKEYIGFKGERSIEFTRAKTVASDWKMQLGLNKDTHLQTTQEDLTFSLDIKRNNSIITFTYIYKSKDDTEECQFGALTHHYTNVATRRLWQFIFRERKVTIATCDPSSVKNPILVHVTDFLDSGEFEFKLHSTAAIDLSIDTWIKADEGSSSCQAGDQADQSGNVGQ